MERTGKVYIEETPEEWVGDMSVTIHVKPSQKYSASELEALIKKWFENNYDSGFES